MKRGGGGLKKWKMHVNDRAGSRNSHLKAWLFSLGGTACLLPLCPCRPVQPWGRAGVSWWVQSQGWHSPQYTPLPVSKLGAHNNLLQTPSSPSWLYPLALHWHLWSHLGPHALGTEAPSGPHTSGELELCCLRMPAGHLSKAETDGWKREVGAGTGKKSNRR